MTMVDVVDDAPEPRAGGRPRRPDEGPEVERQLAEVEDQLVEANRGLPAAALRAARGEAGAEVVLSELQDRTAKLEQQAGVLRLALEAARTNDRQAERDRAIANSNVAIRKVRHHLDERDAAAERLSAHLAGMIEEYRAWSAADRAARAACPHGVVWPVTPTDRLQELLRIELHRIDFSTDRSLNAVRFPWSAEGSFTRIPAAESMADRCRRSSADVVDELRRQQGAAIEAQQQKMEVKGNGSDDQ